MPISTSPRASQGSSCSTKMLPKPLSFVHALTSGMLSLRLTTLNRGFDPTIVYLERSHARCVAVDAEPPLPMTNTVFPCRQASKRISMAASIASREISDVMRSIWFRYRSMLVPLANVTVPPPCLEVHDHFRALEIEVEWHLPQALVRHRLPQSSLVGVRTVEEEKSTPAGADELAARRAVVPRQVVPVVDASVGDLRGAALLILPVGIHQLAEAVEIACLQGRLDLQPQGFGLVEALHDVFLGVCRIMFLVFQDVHGPALDPGIEQEQVPAEFV